MGVSFSFFCLLKKNLLRSQDLDQKPLLASPDIWRNKDPAKKGPKFCLSLGTAWRSENVQITGHLGSDRCLIQEADGGCKEVEGLAGNHTAGWRRNWARNWGSKFLGRYSNPACQLLKDEGIL